MDLPLVEAVRVFARPIKLSGRSNILQGTRRDSVIATMSTNKHVQTIIKDRVTCAEASRALPDVEFL
jgi:hypothetical protein